MRTMLFYACLPFVAYLGLKRPFVGLCLYLAANIIRPEMLFWGGNTGAIFFKVSIGFTLLGYFSQGRDIFTPWRAREFWLMLWVALAVFASLYFATIPLAPKAWTYGEEFFKTWILVWLLIGLVQEKEQILKISNFLLFMISLLALWGWDQSFRGNARLENMGVGDSNGVAAFIVLFFPIALHKFLMARDRTEKFLAFVSTVLLGVMVVFTQSRGGFLGLLAGILYLFLLTPNKKKLALYFVLLVLLATPFISSTYLDRISTISVEHEEDRDFSSASRLVLWKAGWHIFSDNPIVGVGLLNFNKAKMPYKEKQRGTIDVDLLDYTFQEYKVGHSTWFCQLLAEGGLLLTVPYLWLLIGFFVASRKVSKKVMKISLNDDCRNLLYLLFGIEAGIFGFCVSISFLDALLGIFLPVQITIGMILIRTLNSDECAGKLYE